MLHTKNFFVTLIVSIYLCSIYLNIGNIDIDPTQKIYAHNFTPNDYASFIAYVDQFQVELNLLESNYMSKNLTLAKIHLDKASNFYFQNILAEIGERDEKLAQDLTIAIRSLQNMSSLSLPSNLTSIANNEIINTQQEQIKQLIANLDAKIDDIIELAKGPQQSLNPLDNLAGILTNIFNGDRKETKDNTTQPLRFVEIVDSLLRNYGNAYDVNFDMTNMSNMDKVMMMTDHSTVMTDVNNITADSNGNSNNTKNPGLQTGMSLATMNETHTPNSVLTINVDNKSKSESELMNIAEYQTASALADKSIQIFDKELKNMELSNKSHVFVDKLGNGLEEMNNLVKDKSAPMNVMMVVHTKIHPNLIGVFNLKLNS